jgi:hypothetical protein
MSGTALAVVAPAAPAAPATIRLSDGTTRSADPAVRLAEAKARMAAIVGAPAGPAPGTQIVQTNIHGGTDTPAQRAETERQVIAAARETGETTTRGTVAPIGDRVEFAQAVEKYVDRDGFVDASILGAKGVLSFGYGLPRGIKVHASTAYSMLEIARAIDLPQVYVTRWFNVTGKK